ncbi:transmembrane protein 132D isoform X1 [Takifugu rubripes]|uniref:transmembrane protein 132D isoform X1 n=1 Tax=Takifugu rubripes TaxID=31033 RepID=UPI001145EA31|nr:transmembrane protein 132D-like isoform X1 [Takifugu rubripes]
MFSIAETQNLIEDIGAPSGPSPVYPAVSFQVLNVNHVLLRQDRVESPGNSSVKTHTQTFLITGSSSGLFQPVIKAAYGPLMVDAPVSSSQFLVGPKIVAVILARSVRSSSPVVKILFHMPTDAGIQIEQERLRSGEVPKKKGSGAKAKDGAQCVTAYAFWETREVRGACLVSPGTFCVAQLKLEPAWFNSASRSGSSIRDTGGMEGAKELQENIVKVYFQSRREPTGQCYPQDSLQRIGVGRGRDSRSSGTPMRWIGSVSLLRSPPGNPTFYRLRLGGAVVIQTSSKPLKMTDVATFYVFLVSTSSVETFTLRVLLKSGLLFSAMRPSDPALWELLLEPGQGRSSNVVSVVCRRKLAVTAKRGLLEVLQLDFIPKNVSEAAESQVISWHLDLPGNHKDVGMMRIYTTQRDYIGLAPLVMNADILNTAVLTGQSVSVPLKILAVEADGSVTDVTNSTSCRTTEEDVLKISERCDSVFVNGKETRGKANVMLNFTYGFLNAQLEMSVWMPRLPLVMEVADPELSQIKGWRVPVATGSRRLTWDSEEEDEMRKGRGCMLHYQSSPLKVLTHFTAQTEPQVLADPLAGDASMDYFLGPDWQVDVTNLVRPSLKVVDPDVLQLQGGAVLQGRAAGSTTVQVVSPLTSAVLAETTIRVLDDKVSVTELGVQLVSGLSLSLQPSRGSNRAIVAMATTRQTITQLKQEAVVSCWVQFSDGAVTPLDLFDRGTYSLTVSTPDESVATVRRTPRSTFVVAQGEGGGQGALVRVELRICEECQKSKRKSKLAVGMGFLQVNVQSSSSTMDGGGDGGDTAAELPSQSTVTSANKWMFRSTVAVQPDLTRAQTSTSSMYTASYAEPEVIGTVSTTRTTYNDSSTASSSGSSNTAPDDSGLENKTLWSVRKGQGQETNDRNKLDVPTSPEQTEDFKEDAVKTDSPKVIESDIIRTFRAMSDLEIGMYALVGVSCIAILAFLLNCTSHNLCFQNHKSPVQTGLGPSGDTKDHKHDWVWLGSSSQGARAPAAIAPVSALKLPVESRKSLDSICHHTLPAVSVPAVPERTATLGRNRASSQQHYRGKTIDPMANHSATLLVRPQRSEPLHSPTSKRNQVQFTTFTTLDIKHLSALKKNGVDLSWTTQPSQQQIATQVQTASADMPWPVVKPLGEPQ